MISTRQHAVFDYAAVTGLAMLAGSRRVPWPVRGVLAVAGTAALAAQTNYEGGVVPRVGMRAHLVLDAVAGVALCGAGLALRRRHDGGSALLLALGVVQVAIAVRTQAEVVEGPGTGSGLVGRMTGREVRAGYAPLDVPKRVAEGVFVVDSVMAGPLGLVLPVRMTVIVLPDGGLVLHSPTRFSTPLLSALQAIGPVQHLMAPNSAHWTFIKSWQAACPAAVTWAAPGLRERRQVRLSGVRLDRDLMDGSPVEWGGAIRLATVPGALGFREVTLFHPASRTLVLTDLVLNLEAEKLPAPLRPGARLVGVVAPDGQAVPWLRALILLRRTEAKRAMAAVLQEGPERVIFAHGAWFEHDGEARLRRALRWLLV